MSHSLSSLLLLYAQQFEDQHAPQNMTIALREAAKELDRLYAGGCARDQGLTQYCAEAAELAEENADIRRLANKYLAESTALKAEVERLRNELHITTEWSAKVHAGHEEDMAEIERLRAALDAIAELFVEVCIEARAALTQEKTDV